jgi:hypothetical protein
MEESLIEMVIQGIAFNSVSKTPVILLQSKIDNSILPIELGAFEANAILLNLKGIETPRMLTHDLFAHFMRRHGFQVTRLLIYSRDGQKYKAKLVYRRGRRSSMLDVRPSDGIALSLQFRAPIFAYGYLVVSQPEELTAYSDPDRLPPESLYIDADSGSQSYM